MDFQTVINRMLQPVEIDGVTYSPDVTWSNGDNRNGFNAIRSDGSYHTGVDFNYSGVGQNGINLTNPDVFSPVSGTVERVDSIRYGQIIIKDSMGYKHVITHLANVNGLEMGDEVNAGDLIGTMGGKGPLGPNQYDQHIDYKVKKPNGGYVDPESLWNNAGQNGYWPSPYDQEYGPYVPGPYIPSNPYGTLPFQPTGGNGDSEDGLPNVAVPWTDLIDGASAVGNPKLCSPIILDLDGDGVETASSGEGAYFDHENSGFAMRTGWASSDDGLLVMDRDGDGLIESGEELFGNLTKLNSGLNASNGFEALHEFDDNGDDIIDNNDAAWNQLKVWQDIDGDGYSASDEFFTLAEMGIQSINTGYTESTYVDDNGNEHRQVGSFTTLDGTTRVASDVWMKVDRPYTIANEWLDVSDDIAALPDLQGYGRIYDLHQAMVRDTTGALQDLVDQFVAATDPSNRTVLLDQIIFKWTGSENIDPASRGIDPVSGEITIDARKLAALEKLRDQQFVGQAGTMVNNAASVALNHAYHIISETYYAQLMAQSHFKNLYDKITYTWDESSKSIKGNLDEVKTTIQQMIAENSITGKAFLEEFVRTIKGFNAEGMMNYSEFRQSLTNGDAAIDFIFETAGDHKTFGTSGSENLFIRSGADVVDGKEGNDNIIGFGGHITYLYGKGSGNDSIVNTDTFTNDDGYYTVLFGEGLTRDSFEYYKETIDVFNLGNVGTDSLIMKIKETGETLRLYDWLHNGNHTKVARLKFSDGTILNVEDILAQTPIIGTNGDDVLQGSRSTDILDGGPGNDTMIGGKGNDTYYIDSPGDTITENLDEGNDTVRTSITYTLGSNLENLTLIGTDPINGTGNSLNNTLTGNSAANTLSGGSGNDTLDGSSGNDTLIGGEGSDTYIFALGYGQDIISDTGATTDIDRVMFSADIHSNDLIATKSDNDLIIGIINTQDSLTIQNWYQGNKIEQFVLTDGTVLTPDDINYMILPTITGTDNNDTLYGTSNAERIEGLSGDDYINAGSGNDTLNGGGGADNLYGYEGNDVLDGGEGDDTLRGGEGDDTYIYSSGNDRINSYEGTTQGINGNDTVQFGDGLTSSSFDYYAEVKSNGYYDLVLKNKTTGDTLKFDYWFQGEYNQTDKFVFSDGTELTASQISAMGNNIYGTEDNDIIMGLGDYATNTYGLGGDDRIYGTDLNDTLNGGTGNDTLTGYSGDDTLIGGEGNDSLNGLIGNDILYGNEGDDCTEDNEGNDILYGNEGSDYLYSGIGADTLYGGTDNDYLYGGSEGDTYCFLLNDGNDTITDYEPDSAYQDRVLFADDVLKETVAMYMNGSQLIMGYGNNDTVTVNYQTSSAAGVEKIELSNGQFLTDADVNLVIQQMTAFAADNGIPLTSVDDVRRNQDLMGMVVNAWHS